MKGKIFIQAFAMPKGKLTLRMSSLRYKSPLGITGVSTNEDLSLPALRSQSPQTSLIVL